LAVHPTSSISLFSGIGALDLAIGSVFPGSRCLAYVEGEAYAAAVLAARMASGDLDDAPIWSDVRKFPTDGLRGRVDLVAGGFPCQDLSLAGKRAGIDGERSGLYFDLIRIVRDVRPRYVFLENVAAIAVGRALDAVLGALAEVGFDAEWICLRASDVGAPHRRDRWWCLAWDRELVNAESVGRASSKTQRS
jgi:DNA (cytosine-5)-methyltransferase 1